MAWTSLARAAIGVVAVASLVAGSACGNDASSSDSEIPNALVFSEWNHLAKTGGVFSYDLDSGEISELDLGLPGLTLVEASRFGPTLYVVTWENGAPSATLRSVDISTDDDPALLADGLAVGPKRLALSLDGSRLAFVESSESGDRVMIHRSDTGDMTPLINADDIVIEPTFGCEPLGDHQVRSMRWQGDELVIVVWSQCEEVVFEGTAIVMATSGDRFGEIVRRFPTGAIDPSPTDDTYLDRSRGVVVDPSTGTEVEIGGEDHAWSSDGRLAYVVRRDTEQIETSDLWLLEPGATAGQLALTLDGVGIYAPQWSPDGKWIALREYAGGHHGLWLWSAESGVLEIRAPMDAWTLLSMTWMSSAS